ncbi:MAG: AMP-binding protein [Chthoniobacterales bacterium]|nr:AMP-binding protein [Chthoniobacterales bacterium]
MEPIRFNFQHSTFFLHTSPMPTGQSLLREPPEAWPVRGAFLLLNPRLDAGLRRRVLAAEFPDLPDHAWLATSGTGGRLKIVALSRAALEAGAAAVNAHLAATARDVWINPLPLFHAGGLGIVVRSALSGARWIGSAPWNPASFVRDAEDAGATLASLVPAQVHDLVSSRAMSPPSLRAIVVGGGALDETLRACAADLGWPLLPSYGLTETASQVATALIGAIGFSALPLLPHVGARIDESGVLSLRGPSLLTGWILLGEDGAARWEDPKSDGWLRTGDRAELTGRNLRVLGRVDDLVKIRGELVDVAALERALQARVGSDRVGVLAADDERNGGALHVVASDADAAEAARAALDVFPPFARPESVTIGGIPRTALGKIIRRGGGTLG